MGKRKVISPEKASNELASYLDSENIKALTNTQAKMTKLNKYLGVLNRQIQFYKMSPPANSKKPNKYFARVNAGGNRYYFPHNKSESGLKHIIATALYNNDRVQSEELKQAIDKVLKGTQPMQPIEIEEPETLVAVTHPFGHQTGMSSDSEYMSMNETNEKSDTESDAGSDTMVNEAGPSQAGPSGTAKGVSRIPINMPGKTATKRGSTAVSGSDVSESDMVVQRERGTTAKRSKGKSPAKKDLLAQRQITAQSEQKIAETQSATVEDQKATVEAQQVETPENLMPEQTVSATMDGTDPVGASQDASQPTIGAGPLVVSGAGALASRGPMEMEGRTDAPPSMQIIEPALLPIMEGGSSSIGAIPTSAYDPRRYVPPNMRMATIDSQRAQQQFYSQFNQHNTTYSQVNNDNSVNTQNTFTYNMVDGRTFNDTRTQIINQGVDGVMLDSALRALQMEMRGQGMTLAQMQYAQVMFMQQNAEQMGNLLMSNAQAIQEAMSRVIQSVSDIDMDSNLPSSPMSSTSGDSSSGAEGGNGGAPPPPINAGGDTSIGQPVNASGSTQTPSTNTGSGSEYLLRQILEILTIQNSDKLRAIALAKNADQYTPKSSAPVNLPKPQVLPLENSRGRRVIDSDYVVIRPRWA